MRFEGLATASNEEIVVADVNGNLSTRSLPAEYWDRNATGNGTNGYTFAAFGADYVGVGTSAPATKFHVANGQVTISDIVSNTGNENTDRVVVATATGELRSIPAGLMNSPWFDDGSNRIILKNNDAFVGIGTQTPTSVLHVEDNISNATGAMEMRLQNRANNGEVNLRFRTGTNSGGFNDENNSMVLRYTNQYDAMEITNGYGRADVNYSSYFKVRRPNGYVGINVGTANPSDQLEIGQGNVRISDGNLEFGQQHRIQWDDADSFIGDNGDLANQDLYISAAEDLIVRGRNRVIVSAQGANGDFDVEADRHVLIEADDRVLINARGENLDLRTGQDFDVEADRNANIEADNAVLVNARGGNLDLRSGAGAGDEMTFRRGGITYMTLHDDGRLELRNSSATWDLENVGASLLRGNLRAQNEVRFDDLDGGGTQMVVADNDGILAKQPIPTFTNTDDQTLAYNGATGLLSISGPSGSTVQLGTEASIDDQDLTLVGNQLRLTNDATPVDLSTYVNTDAQVIGRTGNTLTITGSAATVNLTSYLDNTDAQDLTYNTATGTLTLTRVGAANRVLSLGTAVALDDQQLSISGNRISLTNGGFVDLPTIAVPDNQQLGYSAATGLLTLQRGGAAIDLANEVSIDDQQLSISGNRISLTNGGFVDLPAGIGSSLSSNLATNGNYISSNGTNAGIYVATSNQVAIGGIPFGPYALSVNGSLGVADDISVAGKVTTTSVELTSMRFTGGGFNADDLLTVDGTGQIGFISRAVASGTVISDERLKRDVAPMTGALDGVKQLRNVSFRYKTGLEIPGFNLDTATHYGLIAQDVAAVFPHAVTEVNGYLKLKSNELTGILFAATNELRAANEDLARRNSDLEAQLAHLKAANNDLARDVHGLSAETMELQKNMHTVLRHLEADKRVEATEH